MELRYFGHSAIQIIAEGATILIDPYITENPAARSLITIDELKPDVILVTHAHEDHWGDTVAIARSAEALVVANHEITEYLARQHDYHNTHAMNTGGMSHFSWGWLKMTYARHSSSFPDGTHGGNANGYLLFAEEKVIYLMGDTDLFAEMSWIGADYDIDIAFVPIGDRYTMGPDDAVRAAELLKPSMTIPIHYNTFSDIEVDEQAWSASMDEAGYVARVVEPGESFVL